MGQKNRKISEREILAVFREASDPYMTTAEIAETLDADITRQGVHQRLLDLYERGELQRKKTGRTVGWWLD